MSSKALLLGGGVLLSAMLLFGSSCCLCVVINVILVTLAFVAYKYLWHRFDPRSIRGKRVLITGASSGIGEQLAYQYSRLGASVVVTARREELLQKVVSRCKALGAKGAEYIAADMGRPEDRKKVASEAERHLGGLDHLILNHAIMLANEWSGTEQDMTSLQQVMEVNFFSFVHLASLCLPTLTTSRGNIGVTSSLAGKIPLSIGGAYSASKFALQGFFGALRQDLLQKNSGVSVTVFVLGYIETEMATSLMKEHLPNHSNPFGMLTGSPPDVTAMVILRAVSRRAYEVSYPRSARVTLLLHKVFSGYIEDYFASMVTKAKPSSSSDVHKSN